MRLDSVLSRTEIVLLVAAEAHSLLVTAGCALWEWLIAVLVVNNQQVLVLLMGQKAKDPSICVSLPIQLLADRLTKLFNYSKEAISDMKGWCKAWKDRLHAQELSRDCSSYPASVAWYYLHCLLVLILLKSWLCLSPSRAQTQEQPWAEVSVIIMLPKGDILLRFEPWGVVIWSSI